jgi:hypothetical protein
VTGKRFLNGSDFSHHSYVTIRINRGHIDRSLSHDWPSLDETLVEVALSEAQWAGFVSTLNAGIGVQCTIDWTAQDGAIPGIARITDRRKQFRNEVGQTVQDAVNLLDRAIAQVKTLGLSAKRADELLGLLKHAKTEVTANVPFVVKAFDEHADTTIERAKGEVSAYVQATIMRAGLTALQGHEPVALLQAVEDGDDDA